MVKVKARSGKAKARGGKAKAKAWDGKAKAKAWGGKTKAKAWGGKAKAKARFFGLRPRPQGHNTGVTRCKELYNEENIYYQNALFIYITYIFLQ